MSKTILVTGGAGFIGAHTVVELSNQGYHPIIIDDLSNSYESVHQQIEGLVDKKIPFYNENCNNKEAVREIFKAHAIDGVIHFAAHKAVNESVNEPLKYYSNNVGSLLVLLELCEEFNVNQFVFSSSCTVYGDKALSPVSENTQRDEAKSPYGNTKQIGEDILMDLVQSGSSVKPILLRYFNPVGAHPSGEIGELPIGVPGNLIPFVTQTAIGQREVLTVFGDDYATLDGSCVRDYIHVVDLAKAHISALDYATKLKKGEYDIFNIGTGQGSSVLEVIETFKKVSNVDLNYKIGPRRQGDVEAIFADTKKSNEVLNWKAEYTLTDALKHAWNWQLNLKK